MNELDIKYLSILKVIKEEFSYDEILGMFVGSLFAVYEDDVRKIINFLESQRKNETINNKQC